MIDVGITERIKLRLEALGKTPRGASLEVGGSPDLFRDVLKGRTRYPRGDNLKKMAAALECSVQWLLTGEGELPTTAPRSTEPRMYTEDLIRDAVKGVLDGLRDARARMSSEQIADIVVDAIREHGQPDSVPPEKVAQFWARREGGPPVGETESE